MMKSKTVLVNGMAIIGHCGWKEYSLFKIFTSPSTPVRRWLTISSCSSRNVHRLENQNQFTNRISSSSLLTTHHLCHLNSAFINQSKLYSTSLNNQSQKKDTVEEHKDKTHSPKDDTPDQHKDISASHKDDTPGQHKDVSASHKDDGTDHHDHNLTIFQRFKKAYKEHGKVLLGVHVLTSSVWFGSFYYLAASGIDVVPVLESWGFSETILSPFKSHLGDIAIAYLLYKIATPARYTVTLTGTSLAIKYLQRKGKIPKPSERERFKDLVKDGREELKHELQEKRKEIDSKIKERTKKGKHFRDHDQT